MINQMRAETSSRSRLKAGALAGLIAGAAFMMMEMGLVALPATALGARLG